LQGWAGLEPKCPGWGGLALVIEYQAVRARYRLYLHVANGGGGMRDAVETRVEGLGGPGAGMPESGRIWRAKLNTEPHGLDIGGNCVYPLAIGVGGMRDAIEARVG
jgi:hypothetical protein